MRRRRPTPAQARTPAPPTPEAAATPVRPSTAAQATAAPRRRRLALPYSIVVLPDTQYYSSNYPDFFDAQTAWIVSEHAAGNVAFVLHEGDIVDDDVATQWSRAYNSLHMLDGVVPYVLSAGNHDYCCGGWPGDRTMTMINAYFPVATFASRPSFKGTFETDRIENSFHLLDVPAAAGSGWCCRWSSGRATRCSRGPTMSPSSTRTRPRSC